METKKEEIVSQNDSVANAAEQPKETKCHKKGIKYKAVVASLILLGFWIGYEAGIRVYFYEIRPYFQGAWYRDYVNAYVQLQLNDFTGGDTPEETVDLFIDALKKGDYELASKYFVINEQEKWKKMFDEATNQQNEDWAKELESEKNIWHKEIQSDNRVEFWYNTGKGENERTHSIYLKMNVNNKWKLGGF